MWYHVENRIRGLGAYIALMLSVCLFTAISSQHLLAETPAELKPDGNWLAIIKKNAVGSSVFIWSHGVGGVLLYLTLLAALFAPFDASAQGSDGTGGAITHIGGKTIHTFSASDVFVPAGAGNIEVLVVAGGGGGGQGGGGAGGVLYNASFPVTAQPYNVTVGNGGAGYSNGSNGNNSLFDTITATGGGGGGNICLNGNAGGSGGGGGGCGTTSPYSGGNGTAGQGNNGGNSNGINSTPYYPGGGGGAGLSGGAGTAGASGAGGIGLSYSISGSPAYYGGGGGGGLYTCCGNWVGAQGGLGGGGSSGLNGPPSNGGPGTPNTGGGRRRR